MWAERNFALLSGAVEYTDCFLQRVWPPHHNEFPAYDTKKSDGEVPVFLEPWGVLLHCHRTHVHFGTEL